MARKNRTVADRQKSLEPSPPDQTLTLGGVRFLYESGGGKKTTCTINGYCRTQIFEFPEIAYHPDGDEPHQTVYASQAIRATVVSKLVDFFESTRSKHYAISPSLRHVVRETKEKTNSQQKGNTPVYLVIEETCQLPPVEMNNGECYALSEILVHDGKVTPLLTGGREGEEFIIATATDDGVWPELPNNQLPVNMILASVRVGQQTTDPIPKCVGQECLVTDDERFVVMMQPEASARLSTATPMDSAALRVRTSEISDAITDMERDLCSPHLALLVNAMYRDHHEDDAYQRLQYLRLWQSLEEVKSQLLKCQGNKMDDNVVVAGNKTLGELKKYRNDIAHWWTDTIDENFMADLQRTINELIRSKYF